MFGRTFWRVARLSLGTGLLGLGVVGLFLPFLQGFLFIILGLTLLSRDSERARRWLHWVKERTHWNGVKSGGAEGSD
jgi:uncharacterized membrane protein YbaN (DUF454 family)